MICAGYFPAYTHSEWADCKNCKHYGYYFGCRSPKVRERIIPDDKDNETDKEEKQ